jgi:hypothetical protein
VIVAYLLLARITDILVGIEEGANVDGLAAPDGSLNSPVQRQLQGAPVERPAMAMSVVYILVPDSGGGDDGGGA